MIEDKVYIIEVTSLGGYTRLEVGFKSETDAEEFLKTRDTNCEIEQIQIIEVPMKWKCSEWDCEGQDINIDCECK